MTTKMTIGKKLMLAFGATLALVLGLAYASLSSITGLGKELGTLARVETKKMELIAQIDTATSEMRYAQRGMVLYSMMKQPAQVAAADKLYAEHAAEIEKAVQELRPLLRTDRGKQAVDVITTSLAAWRTVYQDLSQLCARQQFDEKMVQLTASLRGISEQVNKATDDLVQVQRELFARAAENADTQTSHSRWTAFVLIAICLLVGAVVVFIVRQISSTLRQIAGEMAEGADQVTAAAAQVSSSSQSLAQGASEQAASVEETSASSEEIHSMTRKNSENSRVAAENMTEASQRIGEANRNLEQMVASMNEINASSDKISKIIKVIDEIAFQTNILALNAAVEAARAGEAGMGFAVVADEVRNLAQRCAQAAKDTAGLIEESIAKSNDGKSKLDLVATAVRSITASADKVKLLVEEVKLGSEEQSRGIEQVAKAITQMEKVSQTTAANAEESASASEELSAQSDTLRAIVVRLNGMVGGGAAAHEPPAYERPRHAAAGRKRTEVAVASPKRHAHVSESPKLAALPVPAPSKGEFPMDEDFKAF